MTTVLGPDGEKHHALLVSSDAAKGSDELEVPTCPLRIAEMAIEIQLEKLRVVEAMKARDVLVHKLSDAYTSIREKTEMIEHLKQALSTGNPTSVPPSSLPVAWDQNPETAVPRTQVADLEALIQDLRFGPRNAMGPPPTYEEAEDRRASIESNPIAAVPGSNPIAMSTLPLVISTTTALPAPCREERVKDMANARFAFLASIPLPDNPPDDTLKPIVLPASCTLHEFLGSTSDAHYTHLGHRLGNYRVLQSLTTKWCPNREEHGYFYSPLFKCSTNPRVTTAHRWQSVDVTARMKHPTECFYNREGLWYYAGSYQAFRLEDLTTKEWAQLATETTTYLVKETVSGRKNVSPQNIYEVSQLYSAGALKVACVGLQCVGFNREVYKAILEHANKFTQAKWKIVNTTTNPLANIGAAANTGGSNTGTGVSGNGNKPGKLPVEMSRPVSPTVLGAPSTGFGVIAAGVGLGNGAVWNTTSTLLSQANNLAILSSDGNDTGHTAEGAMAAYRAGGFKK
ncbi:hypothetical protein AGABI1DRAFT_72163 [Agaricus bisporus var. burnettii JB137-S8]|uniref:DUF6697 domain-containing protein n=1 Tax=Agaricus bisporus var. burnettii (strain JB137-S8 / ATCC MYA-4627 / FGSC 10392) TaxID=597362 RepID=K5Y0J1_AGABU|nr:uncharacterized protein AGABI1DRAFT_72163 [Agaricus bisporus var. burnettii JB137-S8]EKM81270.1 hypothetical protein AGABI1DRAFT_72163 [Agaricus bisporus var. burnettii JB137-S8]